MNQSFTSSSPSSPTSNRRRETRTPFRVFANKYIEGMPYMVEILDASADGVSLRTFLEPKSDRETFALELWIGDHRLFAWARRLRSEKAEVGGDREAYQIVAADPLDRARLRKFLRTLAA